jgi:hypothetical protein
MEWNEIKLTFKTKFIIQKWIVEKKEKRSNQYLQTKIYSICHEPIVEFTTELHTSSSLGHCTKCPNLNCYNPTCRCLYVFRLTG